jgi:hypothetical protein
MLAYLILLSKDVLVQSGVVATFKVKSHGQQAIMGFNNGDGLCVNFYTLMLCRFPLKAVKFMHAVALWTEATISCGENVKCHLTWLSLQGYLTYKFSCILMLH